MRDLQGVMPCPEAMQPVLHAGFRSVKVVIRDDGPASLREAAAERRRSGALLGHVECQMAR